MARENKVKVWLGQIRAPFLLLSVVLVLIGGAVAHEDGHFSGLHFALIMVGVVLAHVAVNLFNELSDHKTGIDHHTRRTPFSGGSGSLQAGATTPRAVLVVASAALLAALAIGLFLAWRVGWPLLVFMAVGGICTVFYTSHLAKWMLGEVAAGISLGSFVVLGAYFALAGSLTNTVIWLSIPPGILTGLLLLLNEFPDAEADRRGGRRHLVIVLGYRPAAVIYTSALTASYVLLITGVLLRWFPTAVLLALLTVPLGIKAAASALRHDRDSDLERLVPALGANVGLVLGTDLLIAVGYFIS